MNTLKVKNKVPFLAALLAVLAFLPGSAFAEVIINGPGGVNGGLNAWDVFVFGNGRVITDILRTVSLFMTGSGGYKTVMLTIAMTGFVVAAVKAGFLGPSHFTKMVGYMLMVAFMVFCTFSAKMNVIVNDPISGSYTTVQKVPLIVAGPPVFVTQVGFYFTESIESFFDIPDAFKTASGARGEGASRFNLFAKVAGDMDRFVLTDPAIKRTISAFYADCTIPAIARGRLSTNEMNASPDLVATLEKAAFNSVFTKYFAPTDLSQSNATAPGLGEVSTCRESYDKFKADLDIHAANLVRAQADQWKSTGVSVTNETALTALMEQLGATGGANNVAGYSSAAGLARQKAMLSYNSAAYRDAAASLGNNELLTGLSIAQAEQAQRTNWFVAAEMFNNLMGYVYITLQAFMFAIIPLIFIGFVIPGLGGKLLVNYAQILIWLALWMPSLAIVNYLVTMFGMGELTQSWSAANGVTIENNRTISEYTSNLTMAGAFLGTLVPMITWGLVKGGMAFSEFISAGLASGMAGTAASTISSGNMSMNNISSDNTSMNKFNTAMSSTIGTQTTIGYMNSGAGAPHMNYGGLEASGAGGAVARSGSLGNSLKQDTSVGGNAGSALDAKRTAGNGGSNRVGTNANDGLTAGNVDAAQSGGGFTRSGGTGAGGGEGVNHSNNSALGATAAEDESKNSSLAIGGGVSPVSGGDGGGGGGGGGGNGLGPGSGGGGKNGPAPQTNKAKSKGKLPIDTKPALNMTTNIASTEKNSMEAKRGEDGKETREFKKNENVSNSGSEQFTGNNTISGGTTGGTSTSASTDHDAGNRNDASTTLNSGVSAGWQNSATRTSGTDDRANQDMTSREMRAMMQGVENAASPMTVGGRMAEMFGAYKAMDNAAATENAAITANTAALRGEYARDQAALEKRVEGNVGMAGQVANAFRDLGEQQIKEAQDRVDAREKETRELEANVQKAADTFYQNSLDNQNNPTNFSQAEYRPGADGSVIGNTSALGDNRINGIGAAQATTGVLGIVANFIPAGRVAGVLGRLFK